MKGPEEYKSPRASARARLWTVMKTRALFQGIAGETLKYLGLGNTIASLEVEAVAKKKR